MIVKKQMTQVILLIKVGKKQHGIFHFNSIQDKKKVVNFNRWVKFEEDVESGGRWSKPHVATLSLHSLLELRNYVLNGSLILDMQADQLPTIIGLSFLLIISSLNFICLSVIDIILDDMISNRSLLPEKRLVIRNALLLKHIHQV